MDALRKQLRETLATVFSFYLKTHNFHWNVEGANFYEYHQLFDKIVDDVYGSIDPIAEHLRTIGSYAPGSLSRFTELTKIKDATTVPSAAEMVTQLQADNVIVIESLTQSFNKAESLKMQGLMNFLADRIDQHNKWAWFLRASGKKGD